MHHATDTNGLNPAYAWILLAIGGVILLMACTFIMLQQLNFLQSRSPGFDRENVVVVNAEGLTEPTQALTLFREALRSQPGVLGVSGAELSMGEDAGWSQTSFDDKGQEKELFEYHVDPEYMGVLGMPLVAGRNFDRSIVSDSVTAIILNETAVRDFGWTNEGALGQPFTGFHEKDPARNPVVIGVARDFLKLVVVAILIASPIAYYYVQRWLAVLRTTLIFNGGCSYWRVQPPS